MATLVILVYFPTFSGEFLPVDDNRLIKNNHYIRTLHSPISYLLQEDGVTHAFDTHGYHTGYYRPLLNLTYFIDYKLWGLSAPGFRVTNLFLHIICCFILFHFLQFLINDRSAALLATLIFAIHPVNTEVVSWVASRNNILVTIFSISSLFFYIRGWEKGRRLSWIVSVVTFALGILSKEMGLMVFALFFLYQRLLSRTRRNIYKELLSYLPFIMVTVAYVFLRKAATATYFSPSEMAGFWDRVWFAPYVILWNLRLLFLPYGLHSFVVDYPTTYLNWQFPAGLCYVGFLGIFIWRHRKNRLMIFSVLSFHIALFPTLNIIPTSAITLVSMRWLYFPTVFLCFGIAQGARGLLKINSLIASVIICSTLVYLGSYSYILNRNLWHNESNFLTQEVLSFRNHYYYINYAALLTDTGRPDIALVYLKEAKSFPKTRQRQGQWFNNMGAAHFRLKNYDESLKNFIKAVEYCPSEIEYSSNLGGAYTAVGDYAKGALVLEKNLGIAPESVSLRKNLILTYIKMKRYRDAMRILEGISKKEREKYWVKELLEKVRMEMMRN